MFISYSVNSGEYILKVGSSTKTFSDSILVTKSSFGYGLSCGLGVLNEETKNCINTLQLERAESCPSGYINVGNGTCTGSTSFGASRYCSTGTNVGNGCLVTRTTSTVYSCPSSYTDVSGVCRVNYGYPTVCPSGYTFNSYVEVCYDDAVTSPPYEWVKPTCNNGYIIGATCYSSNSVSKIASCPSSYTFSNGVCTKQVLYGYSYSCPSGYNLSGTTCSATVTVSVTIGSCPSDYYELNITTCEKVEILPGTINCPVEAPNYNESLDACVR